MEIKKILETKKGEKYFVKDLDKDLHTKYGVIKATEIKKAKDGDIVVSDHHEECVVYSPSFIDHYRKIERLAQIPLLKDIGFIIAELGLGKESVIVEGGSGSGGVACFLAHIVKKVYSFEIKDEHLQIIKNNIHNLHLDNVEVRKQSMYDELGIANIDAVFLDLPEPWNAIAPAENTLKVGGFLVSYSPNLSSASDFVNTLAKNNKFSILKTVEVIEQQWDVMEKKIKPKSEKIHSGFITIARKIQH